MEKVILDSTKESVFEAYGMVSGKKNAYASLSEDGVITVYASKPRNTKEQVVVRFSVPDKESSLRKSIRESLGEMITYTSLKSIVGKNVADGIKPDAEAKNPHHSSGPKMRLYYKLRISSILAHHPEYVKKVDSKRSEAAKKAVETKREKAIEYGMQTEVNVIAVDGKKALEACIAERRDWLMEKQCDFDGVITKRMFVNFVRHRLSDYEEDFYAMGGKVGMSESHDILKERYDEAIKEMYSDILSSLPGDDF